MLNATTIIISHISIVIVAVLHCLSINSPLLLKVLCDNFCWYKYIKIDSTELEHHFSLQQEGIQHLWSLVSGHHERADLLNSISKKKITRVKKTAPVWKSNYCLRRIKRYSMNYVSACCWQPECIIWHFHYLKTGYVKRSWTVWMPFTQTATAFVIKTEFN